MTRFEKIKEMNLEDLAVFFSFNFNCDTCEAKRECCSDNCSMCIGAIKDWLNSDGDF